MEEQSIIKVRWMYQEQIKELKRNEKTMQCQNEALQAALFCSKNQGNNLEMLKKENCYLLKHSETLETTLNQYEAQFKLLMSEFRAMRNKGYQFTSKNETKITETCCCSDSNDSECDEKDDSKKPKTKPSVVSVPESFQKAYKIKDENKESGMKPVSSEASKTVAKEKRPEPVPDLSKVSIKKEPEPMYVPEPMPKPELKPEQKHDLPSIKTIKSEQPGTGILMKFEEIFKSKLPDSSVDKSGCGTSEKCVEGEQSGSFDKCKSPSGNHKSGSAIDRKNWGRVGMGYCRQAYRMNEMRFMHEEKIKELKRNEKTMQCQNEALQAELLCSMNQGNKFEEMLKKENCYLLKHSETLETTLNQYQAQFKLIMSDIRAMRNKGNQFTSKNETKITETCCCSDSNDSECDHTEE